MPKSGSSIREQITSFESQVASLLAGFATEASVSRAGLEDNLRQAGVEAKVIATGTAVKVEVQVPEYPGFRAGEVPEDFTEAARDRRAGKYLADRKAAVWKAIRSIGSITAEQKTAALRELGYGDANLPSQKTSIVAEVTGADGKYHVTTFTLDGEHSRESVLERLEAVTEDSLATAVAREAYPDAIFPETEKKVRHLSVSAELTWPSEYTA